MTKYKFLSELVKLLDKYLKDNPEYEDLQQRFELKDTEGNKMQAGVSTYKFLYKDSARKL